MALSKDTINTLEAERAQIEQRIKHNRGLIPQMREQISTDQRSIKALNAFIASMNGSQTNVVTRAPNRDWKAILDAVRQMLFTEQPRKKADINPPRGRRTAAEHRGQWTEANGFDDGGPAFQERWIRSLRACRVGGA